jgi:hypothetical protein
MNELTLTTLYCITDDFINALAQTEGGTDMLELWRAKRGSQRNLSLGEVITLNILRFHLHVSDLKAFHSIVRDNYKAYFPRIPNYENFSKATNASLPFATLFLEYLLRLNRKIMSGEKVFFLDATALSVCENINASRHKVTGGFAAWGKTSRGWFFGFKLHGVCDAEGNLLNACFSSANVYDGHKAEALTKGLRGVFVGDAGYLLKEETFERLFEKHKRILAAARKNMKRLMTKEQGDLLRKRNIIESVWSVLKGSFGLVFRKARSLNGLFRHYCYSIVSSILKPDFLLRPLMLPQQT